MTLREGVKSRTAPCTSLPTSRQVFVSLPTGSPYHNTRDRLTVILTEKCDEIHAERRVLVLNLSIIR